MILASLQLLWALAGLIAEPSFDFGESAVTERVLGVDFNGVHAISGFLLFLPAFYFATRPKWAVYYAIYVAAALILTGIWAFFDTQPAWVFTFPNNHSDAFFHIVTGALFALIAAIQIARDRGPSATNAECSPSDALGRPRPRPLEGAAGAGGAEAEEEDHAAADGHDPHLAADDRQGDGLLGRRGQRLDVEARRSRARRRRRGRPRRGRRRRGAGSRRCSGGRRGPRGW